MSWFLAEYLCERCAIRIESLVERPPPATVTCASCDGAAERVVSAPRVRVPIATVTRGKSDPKPHPHAMDTSNLGEGQPVNEWRRERQKIRRLERHKRMRRLLE